MAALEDDSLYKFQQMKADRFRVLRYVYDETEGSPIGSVPGPEIMRALGFEKQYFNRVTIYLINERLVSVTLGLGSVSLTHRGVRAVEEALERPDAPTRYFPPVNIINFNAPATNTQIQQGTSRSTQTAEFTSADLDAVRAFTTDLLAHLDRVDLADDRSDELRADLSSVEVQIESPNPKWPIIAGLLASVRSILENASGDVAADYLKSLDAALPF